MSDSYQLKNARLSYDIESGYQLSEVYEGKESELQSFIDSLSGYTRLEWDKPMPTSAGQTIVRVTVSWAAQDARGAKQLPGGSANGLLKLTWTLQGVDEQVEMESHPNVVALDQAYEGWSQLVREYVRAFQLARRKAIDQWGFASTGSPTLPTWRLPHPSNDPTLQSYAENYAKLLLLDERPTYQVSRYVLRKSQTVTHWSTLAVSYNNVNRYISYARLNNDEPTLAAAQLLNISQLTSHIWLKKSPLVTATYGGNYELEQEYWSSVRPQAASRALQLLEFVYGPIVE